MNSEDVKRVVSSDSVEDTETRDDDAYFRRIEEHFGRRRGGPLLLSPQDWQLVEDWRERHVPLAIVLRGINWAFDRFEAGGSRPDRINSLAYCEQQVETAWQEYRETEARWPARSSSLREAETKAGSGVVASSGAVAHLRAAAAACRQASASPVSPETRGALDDAAAELDRLAADVDGGRITARQLDHAATAIEEILEGRLVGRSPQAPGTPRREQLGIPAFSPYSV